MRSSRSVVLAVVAVLVPGVAGAGGSYATSVNGPGVGRAALGIGVGVLANPGGVVTDLSLDLGYGLVEPVDLYLAFNAGFSFAQGFAMIGVVEAGGLVRLTPRRPEFVIGLKLAPTLLFLAGSAGSRSGALVSFALTPGVAASFGGAELQATVGVDMALLFASAFTLNGSSTAETAFEVAMRPYAAVEVPVGDSLNLFARVAPLIQLTHTVHYVLVQATAGVVF